MGNKQTIDFNGGYVLLYVPDPPKYEDEKGWIQKVYARIISSGFESNQEGKRILISKGFTSNPKGDEYYRKFIVLKDL